MYTILLITFTHGIVLKDGWDIETLLELAPNVRTHAVSKRHLDLVLLVQRALRRVQQISAQFSNILVNRTARTSKFVSTVFFGYLH